MTGRVGCAHRQPAPGERSDSHPKVHIDPEEEPHVGTYARAARPAIVPAPAGAASDDRTNRRLPVDARPDLRRRLCHAPASRRFPRRAGHRDRRRRQHGLLRRTIRHRRPDRPRQPLLRGAITGSGTFLGGVLHTLPFLIPQYRAAVLLALAAMAFELLTLAWIRRRFFGTGFLRSFISITLGGAIIATIGAALGAAS